MSRLGRTVAVILAVTVAAGCRVYVNVGPVGASASPTVRPDEICDTGLQEISGLQVCVQLLPNSSGSLVAVGFVNPRTDAAAQLTPSYELSTADGSPADLPAESLVGSELGLMATPGSWANDFLQVPATITQATVTLDVIWLPGKAEYAYTRLQYHSTCLNEKPFAGCKWMNHNSYPIRVRSVVTLLSVSADGRSAVENVIAGGPDTLVPPGSKDVFVPISATQSSAVAGWLAGNSSNRFSFTVAASLDQPEFPR